jgi:hypothetical protein
MALGVQLPLSRLPFARGQALPAQAFDAAVEHARAVQGPERSSAAAWLGSTAGLPEGVAGPPPVPAGVPELTLPQYASFRVELHLGRGQEDAILSRYGVRRDAQAPLDEYWRARFEADPLLRMMDDVRQGVRHLPELAPGAGGALRLSREWERRGRDQRRDAETQRRKEEGTKRRRNKNLCVFLRLCVSASLR